MPTGLNVGFGRMLQFFVKLIHLDRITGLSREQDGLGIEKQSGFLGYGGCDETDGHVFLTSKKRLQQWTWEQNQRTGPGGE